MNILGRTDGKATLTKYPGEITGVSFTDNILTVTTTTSTDTASISTDRISSVTVPGRMVIMLSSPVSGIIKVRIRAHQVSTADLPLIVTSKAQNASVDETEDYISFKTGMTEARISKGSPFEISYYFCGNKVVSSIPTGSMFYSTRSGVGNSYTVDSENAIIGDGFAMSAGETYYGLGGAGVLQLNGKEVTINNLNTHSATINVPFFMSSQNYGILVNTQGAASFAFGNQAASVGFAVKGEVIEYEFFTGNNMKEVLASYAQFAGTTTLAPSASLGIPYVVDNNYEISGSELIGKMQQLMDSGIRVTELWLGDSWLPASDKVGFNWDLTRFPEPGVFARKLHDMGIKLGLKINPYISENSPEFKETLDCNFLLKNEDGTVFMCDRDCGGTAVIDVTYMAAKNYLALRCDALLKIGVDYLEADFKYKLFDMVTSRNNDPVFVNSFASIFNALVVDAVQSNKGLANRMIISDSTAAGDHNYPYRNIYSPFGEYSFGQLAATLNNALSYGMSGYAALNIDVPDIAQSHPVLFERWVQFGMLAPHLRIFADPMAASKEQKDIIKTFSNMRLSLAPYLFSACAEASNYGIPVMRPMALEYSSDALARNSVNQYMLGSSILVAPVLNESGNVNFYLPAGNWTSLITREVIKGPRIVSRKEETATMPVFAKPNSVIVSCQAEGGRMGNYLENPIFTVFELLDKRVAAAEIYSNDGAHSGVINVLKEGNVIRVKTTGFGRTKKLILPGVKNIVSTTENMPEVDEYGSTLTFSGNEIEIALG